MAQGSVTIDIRAQVTGYEASLKQLQSAMQKIDIGSDIGKKLTSAISQAEAQLKSLSKNLTPRASSDTQIDAIIEKANHAGEAVQKVAALMQRVEAKDLNLSAFSDGISNFRKEIAALESELEGKLVAGMQSVIAQSSDLKNVFDNILHVDTKGKGPTELLNAISDGAKKAAADVQAAEQALNAIQKKQTTKQNDLTKKEQGPLGTALSRDQLMNQVKEYEKEFQDIFSELREKMAEGLKTKLAGNTTIDQKALLDSFFGGLTPDTIRAKIEELYNALNTAGIYNKKIDFYTDLFGGGRNIDQVVRQIDLGDPAVIADKLRTFLDTVASEIGGDKKAIITDLIDKGQIEAATASTLAYLNAAYAKVQRQIQTIKDSITDLNQQEVAAQANVSTARVTQSAVQSADTTLRAEIEALRTQNTDLLQRIEKLEAQIQDQQKANVNSIRSQGATAGVGAEQWKLGADAALKYKDALDQVHAREQLVGRVQGVVQRWFSIYAAVRMVGNAIRAVTSTIKELDKTITEIAIVTDMSQSDLWGQMDKYTEMARSYASSISGVYKVSQLYYQQGLQTADVMALTEQTLKMARISGLDYATATDYMTNAVRSFKMEMTDAQTVVDVYSAIAANSATSTTELASAMSKTASSAQAVGSSFESTTAMMAVMIEATRESAENIGSALKSIISRYGEMKSDPSKLVDSEGQEMSLNKVDTALQSVGISIHDAAGEFRDFDDVIMELAASWDTIDKNTQRYIATVMAGNRQQSRFLALVSSYDRLKELTQVAAESEDASQLQFLKTLDSVEAKLQQFQTSMQSLYVGSGLENAYKGLLDLGNNIVKTFTSMPKIFNLPILAIAKFGTQFTNLAMIITTAFNLIKVHVAQSNRELVLINKASRGEELTDAEIAELQRIAIEKDKYNELASIYSNGEAQLNEIEQAALQKRLAAAEQANQLMKRQTARRTAGMAISGIGMIGSLIAGNIDVNKDRGLKTGLTAASSVIQGIGTGMMVGGAPGAILGAVTALPGIIEAIGMASESIAEKVDRLKNSLEEASNERIASQDELKTLKDYKTKYEELYKARNDSNEAYQDYVDLSNEIAAKYPSLIAGMDAEGNYVIDLTSNYEALYNAKKQAYNNDFIKEGLEQIKAYSDNDYLLALLGYKSPAKNVSESKNPFEHGIFNKDEGLGSFAAYFEGLKASDWNRPFADLLSEAWSNMKGEGEAAHGDDLWDNRIYPKGIIGIEGSWLDSYIGSAESRQQFLQDYGYDKTGSPGEFLLKVLTEIGKAIDAGKQLDEINSEFSEYFEGFSFRPELFNAFKELSANSNVRDDYLTNIIKQLNISAVRDAISAKELSLDNIESASIIGSIQEQWEKFKVENVDTGKMSIADAWQTFMMSIENNVQALSDSLNLYAGLNDSQIERVRDLYSNIDQYGQQDIDNIITELGINTNSELYKLIAKRFEEVSQSVIKRFTEGMEEAGISQQLDNGKLFTDIFGARQLETIFNSYREVLKNSALSPEKQQEQIEGLTFIYSALADSSFTQQQRATALQAIESGDLTSLTGIYNLIDTLHEAGINIDQQLLDYSKIIEINLTTELTTFAQKIVKQVDDFDKALSNASKGMALDDAIEMATKLEVSIDKFRFEGGKYFYDNAEAIREAYFKYNQELLARLNEEYIALLGDKGLLKRTYRSNGSSVLDIINDDIAIISEYSEENRVNYWKNLGLTFEQGEKALELYNRYFDSWSKTDKSTNFTEYVAEQLQSSHDQVVAATEQYGQYQVNAALIQNGFIEAFIKNLMGEDVDAAAIRSRVLAGDYSDFTEENEQYIGLLMDYVSGLGKSVLDKAMASIKGEGAQRVTVTESNRALLESLGAEFKGNNEAILDLTKQDFGTVRAAIVQAAKDGLITEQQMQSYLADLHSNQYKDNITDSLSSVVDNYQSFGYDAAQSLANAFKFSLDKMESEGFISRDAITGQFSTTIENLRTLAALALERGMDIKSYNQYMSKIDKAEREATTAHVIQDVIKSRTSLTEENIQSLADSLKTSYDYVKSLLTQNADGTYTMSLAMLNTLVQDGIIEINSALQQLIAEQIDSIISGITGLATGQGRGYTNIADMQKYVQQVRAAGFTQVNGQDVNMQSLFEWDASINAFVLTSAGIISQVVAAKSQLDSFVKGSDEYFAITKLIEDTGRQFAERIDVTSILGGTTGEQQQAVLAFTNAVNDYNAFMIAIGRTAELLDSAQIGRNILGGGIGAVKAAEQIAKLSGKQLSASDIETLYRAQVAPIVDAIDQVESSIGSIVSRDAANVIGLANVTELGNTGQFVVTSAVNLVDAYQKLYDNLLATNEATLSDLNSIMARKLEAKTGANVVSALSNAAGMTYTEFGEILTAAGYMLTEETLTQLSNLNILEEIGGGKLRITDFTSFARTMGWDTTSEEYISAFKSYNDAMVALNKKVERDIAEEVQSLSSAKAGDKINVTRLYYSLIKEGVLGNLNSTLSTIGATISDGILTLKDNANLPAIMQAIQQVAQEKNLMLADDLAALADAIDDALKSFADTLSAGIAGTLSHTQANELKTTAKNMFGMDLDFHETSNGLKVSRDQAVALYSQLQAINSIAASIVFDGLRDSLEAAGEDCENITKTMASIKALEAEMGQNPDNSKLQERLNLYNQIAAVQMQNPEQYDFMGRSLPDYLKGPENYWNSIGEAFTAMNEAASSGYMGVTDFYNIVNEMNNLAALGGQIEFLGMTLDGSLESASALIQKGFSALSNVDGKGVKINLGEFGVDFAGGAADMATNVEDGIHAMAQSQIEMLDGMIALLETVVAMEKLGDITSEDHVLDLGDMFTIEGDTATFTEGMQNWASDMLIAAETNKDLANALDSIIFDGTSLRTMLENAKNGIQLTEADAQAYFAAINSLYQMFLSGDYDLDNLMGSISDVAAKSGFEGEIQIGDIKMSVGYGFVLKSDKDGTYDVDGTKYTDATAALQAYALKQQSDIQDITVSTDESGKVTTTGIYTVGDVTFDVVASNGEITYTANDVTYNSQGEAVKALYQQYLESDKGKAEGLTPAQWAEKLGIDVTLLAGDIKIDNPEQFQAATHQQIVDLANALASGEGIVEAATAIGIKVDVAGDITEADRKKIAELAGIESKTVVMDISANFNGEGGPALAKALEGTAVDVTVNIKKGTDETGLINGNDAATTLTKEIAGITIAKAAGFTVTGEDTIWAEITATKEYNAFTAYVSKLIAEKGTGFTSDPGDAIWAEIKDSKEYQQFVATVKSLVVQKIATGFTGDDGSAIWNEIVATKEFDAFTATVKALTVSKGSEYTTNGIDTIWSDVVTTKEYDEFTATVAKILVSKAAEGFTTDESAVWSEVITTNDYANFTAYVAKVVAEKTAQGFTVDDATIWAEVKDSEEYDKFIAIVSSIVAEKAATGFVDKTAEILPEGPIRVHKDVVVEVDGVTVEDNGYQTLRNQVYEQLKIASGQTFGVDDLLRQSSTGIRNAADTMTTAWQLNSDSTIAQYLAALQSIVSSGQTLSTLDMSNLTKLKDAASDIGAKNLDAEGNLLSQAIDSILALNEINLTEQAEQISAMSTAFSNVDPANLQACADAMSQLEASANSVMNINWDALVGGINSINTPTTGNNIVDNGTAIMRDITASVTLTYANAIAQELLESTSISRTIQLVADATGLQDALSNLSANVKLSGSGGGGTTGTGSGTAPTAATPNVNTSGIASAFSGALSAIKGALAPVTAAIASMASGGNTANSTLSTLASSMKSLPSDAAGKVSGLAGSMGSIPSVSGRVSGLASAMNGIPNGVASRITTLTAAINKIPTSKTIAITATVKVNATGATVTGQSPAPGKPIALTMAKGNVALVGGRKKRTLMGELGAELVVTNGHYFLVGQNGAEMVDLPEDAIVFNHIQTKQLLSSGMSGRGKAITNERNATSMATGNVEGPAMASASAALAALKQIRAMWQSMLDASLKDLGQQAGSGGGGGGGGKKKNTIDPGFIADLERWYNLLRQIERLEKSINYEEKLRQKLSTDSVSNGKAYYESQKRSLEALQQQIVKNEELSYLQKSYYDARRQDLEKTNFGKIFTFDENGLMQYNDTATMANGDKGGLFALAKINAQNADNSPVYTAREQYALLKAWGFDEELKYDNEGKLIEWTDDEGNAREEAYTEAVQAFWDKIDGWKDELDGLYDSYTDSLNDLLDEEAARNEILNEMRDNQLSLEQKVLKAIENREQKIIDNLQDERDAIEDASKAYLDGLNDQLDRERKMYQREQEEEDLNKLRRQLAILQRSGGSAAQIRSLQNQITAKEQDAYFNAQQDQIDAIQEASDKEIERLDAQLDVMKESLEYQKEHGLLWAEVKQIMDGTPDEIMAFLKEWSPELSGLSALGQETTMQSIKSLIEQWVNRRDDKDDPLTGDKDEAGTGWRAWAAENQSHYSKVWNEKSALAEQAYYDAYKINSNPIEAAAAARKVLDEALEEYYKLHPSEDPHNPGNQVPLDGHGSDPQQPSKPGGGGTTTSPGGGTPSTPSTPSKQKYKVQIDGMGAVFKEASSPSEAAKLAGASAGPGYGYTVWDESGNQVLRVPAPTVVSTSDWKSDNTYHWKVKTYSNGSTQIVNKEKHNENKKVDTGATWTCYCDKCGHYMGIKNKTTEKKTEENKKKPTGGGCFVKGTKVTMADYTIKNIEDIKVGDFVIAYNDLTNNFEPRKVTKSYIHHNTPRVLNITLSNNVILGITPGHPILTINGWKSRDIENSLYEHGVNASWLEIGDQVIGYNINVYIKSIEEKNIPTNYDTYNIEVETCHTYMVENIVVHNMKMEYATGGLADYTGLAMVHGSKTRPEAFLNANETKMWREDILSGKKGSLTNSLVEFQAMVESMTASGVSGNTTNNNGGNVTIEHAEVNVEASVASDYDARRIGQNALEEMVKIARKSSVQSIGR